MTGSSLGRACRGSLEGNGYLAAVLDVCVCVNAVVVLPNPSASNHTPGWELPAG